MCHMSNDYLYKQFFSIGYKNNIWTYIPISLFQFNIIHKYFSGRK